MINKREYHLPFSLLFKVIVVHSLVFFSGKIKAGPPVSRAFHRPKQHLVHLAWKWVMGPIKQTGVDLQCLSKGSSSAVTA